MNRLSISTVFLLFSSFLMSSLVGAQDFPLAIEEMRKSIEKDTNSKFDTISITKKRVLKEDNVIDSKKRVVGPAKKPVEVKKLSLGEQRVQAMLAANRERLQKRKLNKNSSGKTRSKSKDWIANKASGQSQWIDQTKQSAQAWRKSRAKSLKRWAKDRARFKKQLPKYKKALTKIPEAEVKIPVAKTVEKKTRKIGPSWHEIEVRTEKKAQMSFIAANFKQKIRNQGPRPTCAAFAAVRAVEIKARMQGVGRDLSEQYFYYASKPECQDKPCSKPGSWPRRAFISSKQSVYPDIPLEKNCPYQQTKERGNDTQIPLRKSCRKGAAKIENFSKVTQRQEIQDKIRAGHPVVGGFKLSKNFYLNNGHVFKTKNLSLGKDSHAQGHALLLVGVMELPAKLHATQGRFCTIVANSWGEGWGKGGYACLSDAWFDQFRYNIPFLSVEKVSVI